MKAQNQWLLEQLRLVRRRKFGASSEKASEEVYEQLSLLFDEAEVYASKAAERENEAEPEPAAVEVRSHTRKRSGSARDILPEDIPVKVVEHELSEEERTCPQCGEQMAVIGREIRETLVLEPARAYLRQDVYFTYGCRRCEKEDISTPILNTPKEPSVIPGGYASPEAAEIRDGFPALPTGAGMEPAGHPAFAADHVQLADPLRPGLVDSGL